MARVLRGVLLVGCVVLWASLGHAVEYFVDNTCTGCFETNDCTAAQTPTTGRRTINKGIECLNPGDTLTIHGGLYPEYIQDTTADCPTCKRIPAGTSWATATTVQGKAGEVVILRPAFVGLPGAVARFRAATDLSHYIILKNLVLDGSLYTGGGQLLGGLAIYGPNHHIRCDGCTIQDTRSAGGFYTQRAAAESGPESNGNEFINGQILRAGSKASSGFGGTNTSYGHCVYMSTSNNIISNNFISGCAGNGVSIYRHGGDVTILDNNIVRNNIITGNASCRTLTTPGCSSNNDDDGMIKVSGDFNQIYNNVLYDGRNGGITVGTPTSQGIFVANNTVCGITGGPAPRGIRVKPGTQTATVVNNLVHNVSTRYLDEGSGTTTLTNSFNTPVIIDPRFVNPCTMQRLTAASPVAARTGGTNLSTGFPVTFTTDVAGLLRTVGWSMGAYEYGETTGVLHLTFSTPPAPALEGMPLAPVHVQVFNEANVLQTGHAADCVISKASGPGTLSGTLNVAPVGGVCTFTTLALSQEGTYTLLVTSTGTTAVTSSPFTITDTAVEPVAPVVGLKLYGVR